MHPCAGLMRDVANLGCRVEGSRIDIASLDADNGLPGKIGYGASFHTPLAVDGYTNHAFAPQSYQTQGFEQADMHLLAHHHRDWRGAKQPLGFHIPAHL